MVLVIPRIARKGYSSLARRLMMTWNSLLCSLSVLIAASVKCLAV
jgi:hypothetical protein